MVEIQSALQAADVNAFIKASGNGIYWNGLQRLTTGFPAFVDIVFYFGLIHTRHFDAQYCNIAIKR